jgi:Sulfotransferase family
MHKELNKPIFVVGSPRSGTSVLTWCLAQHPNIFSIDESTGIGDLAVALTTCHERKMGLGPDSLWSAMKVQRDEFFAAFGQTINELILRHKVDLEERKWEETFAPDSPPCRFPRDKAVNRSKTRWVDGTPLYSSYIYGLRKLFPDALFIHIIRDVTSAVRSMLNFHRLTGVKMVDSEQQAYDKWFRMVRACLLAEDAYGPNVVFRLPYAQLTDQPEVAMRALLNFLDEAYMPQCLTPLQKKINSSNVPPDFRLTAPHSDRIIQRATQLHAKILTNPQTSEPSLAAAAKLEAEFFCQKGTELEEVKARVERLVEEIKRKRAFIQELRASPRRHKLRRLLLGYKSTNLFSCAAYLADALDFADCLSFTT